MRGLGVTYDSVVYVQASHALSSISLPQPDDHGGEPLYWWAPVYPLALKLVGGGYDGARFLNAFLLLTGVILIGALTWKSRPPSRDRRRCALRILPGRVHRPPEPSRGAPLPRPRDARAWFDRIAAGGGGGGLAAAAATLTRYAGLPLILAGAILLRGRDRLRSAASIAPYALWIVRNQLTAGEASGRQARWHPPDWAIMETALRTTGHLF